jgi:hypothetical protein
MELKASYSGIKAEGIIWRPPELNEKVNKLGRSNSFDVKTTETGVRPARKHP